MGYLNKPNAVRWYTVLLAFLISLFLIAWLFIFLTEGRSIVPAALNPPFADLITITGSVECMRAGMDPYVVTTFDPWGRTYNYPRLFLTVFNFFGISRSATNIVGIVLILLFYISTISILKINNWVNLLFASALVLSPPILLLLERGNGDIILYLLVLLSFLYLRKASFLNENLKVHLSYIIILFATMLKIYPVFLLSLLIFEKISRRQFYIIASYSAVVLACYFAFTYEDILLVRKNTPVGEINAYGKNVFLQAYFSGMSLAAIANGLMLLVLVAALYVSTRYNQALNRLIKASSNVNRYSALLFIAGGVIYAGTFFIGNNWDYRLVFLLLTVPFFMNVFNAARNNVLRIILFCIFFMMFYGSYIGYHNIAHRFHLYEYYIYPLEQLSGWGMLFIVILIIIQLYKIQNETKHSYTGIQ